MTTETMTELAIMVVDKVASEPLTDKGIEEYLHRKVKDIDDDVARCFCEWMAGRKYLKLSPGFEKVKVWMPGDEAYRLREGDE